MPLRQYARYASLFFCSFVQIRLSQYSCVMACDGGGSSTRNMVTSLMSAVRQSAPGTPTDRLWQELMLASSAAVRAMDQGIEQFEHALRHYRAYLISLGEMCNVLIEGGLLHDCVESVMHMNGVVHALIPGGTYALRAL